MFDNDNDTIPTQLLWNGGLRSRLSKPLIHTWPSAGSERRHLTDSEVVMSPLMVVTEIAFMKLHYMASWVAKIYIYMSVNSQSHFPAYVAEQTLCRKFHQHWPFFT